MRVRYQHDGFSPRRQIAPGLFLQLPGTARFEDVELEGHPYSVTLEVDMTAEGVRAIKVAVETQEGSPPVTSTTLRAVKVGTLLRHALTRAIEYGQEDERGSGRVDIRGRAVELSDEDVARIRAQGPTDESLEVVARFYNLAAVLGFPPAKQVELNLDLPRTTASKWIRRARDKGLLGDPMTAGDEEHHGVDPAET